MINGLMGAEESIRKHEESKKAREVSRTMDGSKTTGTVENGMEPAITVKLRVALNKSVQYRSAYHH